MTKIPDDLFARTILASQVKGAAPIYTLHLRYPRIIHSEVMTHRVFSRNARSSRAVPVNKMIQEIQAAPFVPWHWTANQPGMQGVDGHKDLVFLHDTEDHWENREDAWLIARDRALSVADSFRGAGYHKQLANRLLEPFMWIDTLVTATEWDNFLELRDHADAEPHLRDLAVRVRWALENAEIQKLEPGEWHMPYVTQAEKTALSQDFLLDLSAVRNARISYAPFDGQDSREKELDRVAKLKGRPLHASPFEHVAMADPLGSYAKYHRNFRGYAQYRGFLEAA